MTTALENELCPRCGQRDNRAVTVTAVFVRHGKILLTKREEEPHAGHWSLLSGYVEKGQTTVQAAIAGSWEKARMYGQNPVLIGVFDDPGRHPKQEISVAYAFAADDGAHFSTGDPREAEVGWFDPHSLPPLAFDHAKIIATLVARQ